MTYPRISTMEATSCFDTTVNLYQITKCKSQKTVIIIVTDVRNLYLKQPLQFIQ